MPVIMKPFFERKSINQLDAFLKSDPAKILFNSTKRRLVCCATTITRQLEYTHRSELKDIIRNISLYYRSLGLWNGLNNRVIGSLDGSGFGSIYGVCLQIAGMIPVFHNFRGCGKGEEFTYAIRLLKEELSRLPKGAIDMMLADALYLLKKKYFKILRRFGIRGVVKYTPKEDTKQPDIVLYAASMIDQKRAHLEFKDTKRSQIVNMWQVNNCKLMDLNGYFTVIRVIEGYIGGNKTHEYYIIIDGNISTSGKGRSFTLKDYRELAKGSGRWAIEIDGFKQLNQLMDSKRKYFKNPIAQENMLACLMISFNMMSLYEYKLSKYGSAFTRAVLPKQRNRINLLKIIHEELIIYIATRKLSIFEFFPPGNCDP